MFAGNIAKWREKKYAYFGRVRAGDKYVNSYWSFYGQ